MSRAKPLPMLEGGEQYMVRDGRLRRVSTDPFPRQALGSDPPGLRCACAYCYPALVTAHTYRDGLPACPECADQLLVLRSRMPAFLLREAK